MNSIGMINDTKRKEVKDAYALDKPEQLKPFLTKGHESQSKYEENASKDTKTDTKTIPSSCQRKRFQTINLVQRKAR